MSAVSLTNELPMYGAAMAKIEANPPQYPKTLFLTEAGNNSAPITSKQT